MKAIVFDGSLSLQELPTPQAENEALVRVAQVGICNTDLEITRGYHAFHGILGHEFVGRVEQAPDSRWLGRRVVGEINCVCHHCDLCRRGLERHCRHRTVLGIVKRSGALAEFLTLPLENLHDVPDEILDDEAVFVEPLAAACEILDQVPIHSDDRLCVVGDGKLAQLITQVLIHESKQVTVIGRHERKLELMRRWGGETLFADAVEALKNELAGSFDVVVEATGSPGGFKQALWLVRPRGILVMKSTYHGELQFDAALLVVNEIQVVGSRCGPFSTAIQKLRRREVEVTALITDRFALADGVAAFARAAHREALKVLVRP